MRSERSRRGIRERTHHAVRALEPQHAAGMSPFERLATRLTAGVRAFDPFPFGLLTMVVLLEALFLSIFVLMTQNRESAITEVCEEVTLAVNLRVEEEIQAAMVGLRRR